MYSSVSEKNLSSEIVRNILIDILPRHQKNVTQIKYLEDIEKGKQDIYKRTKKYNDNVMNKIVENHINHAVSFKKGYVFGYPLQYVQATSEKSGNKPPKDPDDIQKGFDNVVSEDLGVLNKYMRANSKASKDVALSHWLYVAGVAPRYFVPRPNNKSVPFQFYNLDPKQSAVVYHTGFEEKPLFGFYLARNATYDTEGNKVETLTIKVYTRKRAYTYVMDYNEYIAGTLNITYVKPKEVIDEINALGFIPIVEYELNKNRVSLVERMLGAQNALNSLTSAEVDDVEQFVQAIMVFINADVDEETLEMAKEYGAITIKSSNNLEGDVKLLTSKLSHVDSKVLHDRILQNMLINSGIPLINIGGGGGDTGIARLTDNGWLMADTKAREDELSFVESEKPFLEMTLGYLRNKNLIKEIDIYNIETKFTRHKSDNLLTKTQALQSMVGVLHPEDAFSIADLLSDPNESVAKAMDFYGEDFFKGKNQEKVLEKNIQPTIPSEDVEE